MFTKDFWKYFIATYRDARWVLFRYIIVAVGALVVGIIANRMNLYNLTYFNAVLMLVYVADMVSWSICSATKYFANQNINDKQKVEQYLKFGALASMIIVVILVVVLLVFRDFVIHTFWGLPRGIDYTFYYLMVGGFLLLSSMARFFTDVLKNLKYTRRFFAITLLNNLIIILGFVFAFVLADMSMIALGIVHIAMAAVCIVVLWFMFYKDRDMPINIFKPIKLHLKRHEISTALYISLAGMVWVVGYTLMQLFLLQSSIIAFNQIEYFHNVLNISYGFLFSFVIITSISINRSLGERDFDGAYRHAKYSLYATGVIWFGLLIIGSAVMMPLVLAMNPDIRTGAITAYMIFIAANFFWFYAWVFSSYILCWGGERTQFTLELFTMVYYLAMYIVATQTYVTSNIFLLYLL